MTRPPPAPGAAGRRGRRLRTFCVLIGALAGVLLARGAAEVGPRAAPARPEHALRATESRLALALTGAALAVGVGLLCARRMARLRAAQAGLARALEARTHELDRALAQQTATAEVLRAIASSPGDVQPVFDAIAERATRLCDGLFTAVLRYDGERLHFAAHHNLTPGGLEFMRTAYPMRPHRGQLSGRAVLDRAVVHVADLLADPDYDHAAARRGGWRSMLAVPMLRDGVPIGTINVARAEPTPFTDPQIALLRTFADQAVIALEHARLVQELQQRNAELTEALEQQTATAEVLRVIAGSRADVGPVLDVVAWNATRLCGADDGVVLRAAGGELTVVAHDGPVPAQAMGLTMPIAPDSVAGRAVLERRTIHVHDLAAEGDAYPRSRELRERSGERTTLAVPMLREDAAVGAIVLRRRDVRPFTDRQIALLETFADQAAIAIENVRLFEALQARTQELTQSLEEVRALSEVIQAVSSSLDVQHVLDTIMQRAVSLAGADACAVLEFDPTGRGTFVSIASLHLAPAFLRTLETTTIDPRRGAIQRAAETGEPFQIPDVAMAPSFPFARLLLDAGFRAVLAVPMGAERVTRGLVLYRRAPGAFDDRVVGLLRALAGQSYVAIENARLFQEVERQRRQLERLSRNLEQLYRLSSTLQEALSLREQLARVLEAAREAVAIDRFYIWAVDPAGERFVNIAGAGFAEDEARELEGASIPLAEAGALTRAYREAAPLVFDEQHPLPPELRLPGARGRLRSVRTRAFMVIPMIARGRVVGVLAADNKPSRAPLRRETIGLLQTFASHAAVAIDNARLFQELEDKTRQLERADRHKSEFLASMSHELRTPLNAIIGFSEVLLERMFGELNAKQAEYVEDILASGRHLLSLINDILDLSKIEAGRMELDLRPVDLRAALANALALVRGRAERQGVRLRVAVDEGLGPVVADERKVKQVLLNLLSNAVKFTAEGGEVTVRATDAAGDVAIAVSDTGIGIAPEDQAAIFEEFRQVGGDPARKREGTGLGLALARKLVELHGGRIWVESEVGRGATFTFTIPERPWPAS